MSMESTMILSTNGFPAAMMVIFITLLLGPPSTSAYSSDRLQLPQLSVGRNLLQAKEDCPIDIQGWNYTILTSQCKGPRYPAEPCCEGLKDLACPYAKNLNDLTNNCATIMFSYISLYGNYPPGLFANICKDSKRGLECTAAQKAMPSARATSSDTSNAALPTIASVALFFFLPILYSFWV